VAGRIPQHFIDELIARTDIVELIGSRVQMKRAGREYKACCPFHDEKTPSFTVSPDKQFYHCFGCGAHGTALGFIMEYDHLGFVEAVEDLASRAGLDVPREGGTGAAPQPNDELYAALERASLYFRQCLSGEPRARAYLDRRGIGAEAAQQFAIGYAPPGWDALLRRLGSTAEERQVLQRAGLVVERQGDPDRAREDAGFYDRFRDRIMFPIRDVRGRVIGFGGRVLDSGEPKYLNSPETELFHKGRELYGLFESRQATRKLERILVVEGYMDVVSLHQAGITYAVATLGTATTPEHLQRVFRLVGELVFCFDGDRAGRAAAWRALENAVGELKQGRQVRFLFLPEGEDPDSLIRAEGREAFERRIAQAMPLSQYLIQELGSRSETGSVDGRAKLVELARPLLSRIPSDVYRELLVAELAEVVGISGPRLLELLGAAGSPDETRRPAAPRQSRSRGSAARSGRGNLVRQAITLLVHYPSAAAALQETPAVEGIERPGIPLLTELLHQLREDPASSTAALLERWRARPEYGPLSRLASAECLVSDAAAAASELESAIARLIEEEQPAQRLDYLLGRARDNSLTDEEKQELKSLLQAKGQSAQRQPSK
jgi:DNA primase